MGVLSALLLMLLSLSQAQLLVGAGIYDVTGEVADVGFMGYARGTQKGRGIHTRIFARAFVFADENDPQNPASRITFVSADVAMGFHNVKLGVIDRLHQLLIEQGDSGSVLLYTMENVMLSGTHTHSTPGGTGSTVLVDITTLGFVPGDYEAAVDGVARAILRAHNSLTSGSVFIADDELTNANINRSPVAYLRNPPEERSKYKSDTDTLMTVLKVVSSNGTDLGLISWFAVHGTSMNFTNLLVSGDNKGYASQYVERANGAQLPGQWPAFVAAFGQSNEGDVSPNTRGPHCPDGSPCDFVHSTCPTPKGPRVEGCIASGPGVDMEDSTRIIGLKQALMAQQLYASATQQLSPIVGWRHTFTDMQQQTVQPQFLPPNLPNGTSTMTCLAAMGYAFAAGTTDGYGDFDFYQSDNTSLCAAVVACCHDLISIFAVSLLQVTHFGTLYLICSLSQHLIRSLVITPSRFCLMLARRSHMNGFRTFYRSSCSVWAISGSLASLASSQPCQADMCVKRSEPRYRVLAYGTTLRLALSLLVSRTRTAIMSPHSLSTNSSDTRAHQRSMDHSLCICISSSSLVLLPHLHRIRHSYRLALLQLITGRTRHHRSCHHRHLIRYLMVS